MKKTGKLSKLSKSNKINDSMEEKAAEHVPDPSPPPPPPARVKPDKNTYSVAVRTTGLVLIEQIKRRFENDMLKANGMTARLTTVDVLESVLQKVAAQLGIAVPPSAA